MHHRRGVATLAACAALACSGIVRAAAVDSSSDGGVVLRPTYLQAATAPTTDQATTTPASQPATPPKPLMGFLDAVGVGKPLDDAGITLGGWVDGGYTVTTNGDSPNVPIAGRVFDYKNNRVLFNQADIAIDRTIDYGKAATNHTIDIGGHAEIAYGADMGLIHSSGLWDSPGIPAGVGTGKYRSRVSPENQFDLVQAYADVALPIGSGLRIRAGKFVTLLGYEVINPSGNPFYSHSYEFGFAIPFTQTGIMGEYKLSDDWLLDAGITRGWNQSLKDNNGDPDFLGALTWTPQGSDFLKKWKVIVNLSEGPQATHDNSDWWTVVDAQAIFTATDKLTLAADLDYGDAPHALGVGNSAEWYAIAGYAALTLNDNLTFNARGEYYGDSKSFTIGTAGGQENLYEITLNLAIKPFPADAVGQNLVIRPEVRYDYSDKLFFKGGAHHDQATFGIDAYFTF